MFILPSTFVLLIFCPNVTSDCPAGRPIKSNSRTLLELTSDLKCTTMANLWFCTSVRSTVRELDVIHSELQDPRDEFHRVVDENRMCLRSC